MNQENTAVFYFDPCHLQHNVVNARMWQPRGRKGTIEVKTNSGRKRINILGALNFKDLSVITTLTEETCNKERIVEFLQKIRETYPEKDIVVILDNASYNHAKYTTAYAEWYNIKLLFLPPYSPNLNLIERLWKFTKKKLVHNIYYPKFKEFLEKVREFFGKLNNYKSEISGIMSKKFEILIAG
jgi:transposase